MKKFKFSYETHNSDENEIVFNDSNVIREILDNDNTSTFTHILPDNSTPQLAENDFILDTELKKIKKLSDSKDDVQTISMKLRKRNYDAKNKNTNDVVNS